MFKKLLNYLSTELSQKMRVGVYIRLKYEFDSVGEFEAYVETLQEKAAKYDRLMKNQK